MDFEVEMRDKERGVAAASDVPNYITLGNVLSLVSPCA
jgi:hypothetical protein